MKDLKYTLESRITLKAILASDSDSITKKCANNNNPQTVFNTKVSMTERRMILCLLGVQKK